MRSKKQKRSHTWLMEHLHDPYVQLAQKEGYRSRAAYKLQEMDEVFQLVRPGRNTLDLGSSPGAWSQYLQRCLAKRHSNHPNNANKPNHLNPLNQPHQRPKPPSSGHIWAVDMLPMEAVDGVEFIQGDFESPVTVEAVKNALAGRKLDLLLSDMSPDLSGIACSDSARVGRLLEAVLVFAKEHLHPEGILVAKAFHGSGYSQLVEDMKHIFKKVKAFKPKASRAKSAESFLLAWGLKD